jgi:hypothetical protein
MMLSEGDVVSRGVAGALLLMSVASWVKTSISLASTLPLSATMTTMAGTNSESRKSSAMALTSVLCALAGRNPA